MALSPNLSGLRGRCPAPFFQEDHFPTFGGLTSGRLCFPLDVVNATCCAPCPLTDWTYPDGFNQRSEVGSWVNVAAIFATAFLLLSFMVLPVKWTHRHYLSICLSLGVLSIELAFVVPLATKPEQCFNEITPNDMISDLTCAFSGAFLLFGGLSIVIWVFWRALSLHLQICWEVVPGPKFFYSALAFGWGIPIIGLATTMSLTGVSYRFGNVCHINHKNGLQDYWGPLLAFAALAMVLQFITIGYCIQVYLKSLLDENNPTSSTGSALPSYQGSVSTRSARQAYRRVKRVVQLQWRGATIVLLIIAEVVFFSVVFVSMDNSSQITPDLIEKATPWVECLMVSGGNKNLCLPKVAPFVTSEPVVLGVLVCLGLSGFWCLLFLGRWSMVLGWRDLIRRYLLTRRREFISVDAARAKSDPRTYEMLDSKRSIPALNLESPGRVASSPTTFRKSQMSPYNSQADDYFGQPPARVYSNTSSPLTPDLPRRNWDAKSSYAKPTVAFLPGAAVSKYYGN